MIMKKFLLSLLLLSPMALYAQLTSTGYYRIQNYKTERYFLLVDNRAKLITTASTQDIETGAFKLVKPFEDRVAWNPATICLLTVASKTSNTSYRCNVSGQGLDLYKLVQSYMDFRQNPTKGAYTISGSGTAAGVTLSKYLTDSNRSGEVATLRTADAGVDDYAYWNIRPINDKYYFGIKPAFKASLAGEDSLYFTTMYASFPFETNENVKAYYITEERDGYAKIRELTTSVPGAAPVFLGCKGATPAENKVNLLLTSSASVPANRLKGVYYCNDVKETTEHRNVKDVDTAYMRVLGRADDGRLAFIKPSSDLQYIPANSAYLQVAAGSPDVIYVVRDIPAGIETLKTSETASRPRGVFSLSGQRLADTTDGLPKGIYIVNGRKTVVK